MKKAVQKGAHAINYAKVTDFIYHDSGKIAGAVVTDQINGTSYKLYAKKIINAGGPWVDELREIDGSKQGKALHLTKGVHLVSSQARFPLKLVSYFDAQDVRLIFPTPRGKYTSACTSYTDYNGDIAHRTVTVADRDYLLEAINAMFPSLHPSADDVESSSAGLRPLIAEEGKS